jgi:hypothetical protein
MRMPALLLLALCLSAQDLQVVHLSDEDARYLRAAYERKMAADREWLDAKRYAFEKYVTLPGLARSRRTKAAGAIDSGRLGEWHGILQRLRGGRGQGETGRSAGII